MGEVMLYLCAFGDRSVYIKYANNCVWGSHASSMCFWNLALNWVAWYQGYVHFRLKDV